MANESPPNSLWYMAPLNLIMEIIIPFVRLITGTINQGLVPTWNELDDGREQVLGVCMYKLNGKTARDVFEKLHPFLINHGQRSTRAPPIVRFFTKLNFLAHVSYQKPVGTNRFSASSQASVSLGIHEVVDITVQHLANWYIKWI